MTYSALTQGWLGLRFGSRLERGLIRVGVGVLVRAKLRCVNAESFAPIVALSLVFSSYEEVLK